MAAPHAAVGVLQVAGEGRALPRGAAGSRRDSSLFSLPLSHSLTHTLSLLLARLGGRKAGAGGGR